MQARDLMTQPVVSVRPEASLAEAAEVMVKCRVGCVTVVDEEGRLRGIVSQTDFAANEQGLPFSIESVLEMYTKPAPGGEIERVRADARKTTVKEIMITEVITATEETPVEAVARAMLRYDIDHVPVVRDGMPIGIVSRHDFLRMIAGATKAAHRG
jgi:CBS domain-containing protein